MLANMAEMVVREIERDQVLQEQRLKERRSHKEHQQLLRAIDCFKWVANPELTRLIDSKTLEAAAGAATAMFSLRW